MSIVNEFDLLTTMIQKAVRADKSYRYSVPRMGQVRSVDDEDQIGRVLVICDSLGWTSDDQGVWAYPKDKRRLVTPKKDDYVVLEWIDGDRDKPVLYSSIAYWMKGMLPKSYDGNPTTQVLFEDNEEELSIVYDEENKILKIVHSKDEYSINWDKDSLNITDKENQSWLMDTKNKKCEFISTNDVKLILNGNDKKTEMNDSVNSIKTDGNAGSIVLENQSGKKTEMTSTSIKMTGATGSFEVL